MEPVFPADLIIPWKSSMNAGFRFAYVRRRRTFLALVVSQDGN
jgi:hypothetical protein